MRFVFVLAFALGLPLYASAQLASSSSSIRGAVSDPQKRPIAGASVTLTNADWNLKRVLTTSSDGAFAFASLPPGTYTLQASAGGFAFKGKPSRITLASGTSLQVNLALSIAGKSESVTVSGTGATVEGNTTAPAVDRDSPTESNSIAGLSVTYLPTRDRDLLQFGQLSAATVASSSDARLILGGQRPEYIGASIDGAGFNDVVNGGAGGSSDSAIAFPQTAVRDFQVIQAGGQADIGETSGGLVKVATKSGSNKFRGEGFYMGRPSGLTTSDAFAHSLANSQNQFGGSVGGPLRRDRIFYYAGGEQDFLNNPFWTQFQPQAAGTVVPAALADQQVQTVSKSSPTLLYGKLDFVLPRNSTLSLQANFNRVDMRDVGFGSTRVDFAPSMASDVAGHSTWLRANYATVVGSGFVNQALLQWAGDRHDIEPVSAEPEVDIVGFGRLGGNADTYNFYRSQREQFSDDLSLSRGRWLLHAGANYDRAPVRLQRETDLNGLFTYASLGDYVANAPLRFQQTFISGDPEFGGTLQSAGVYGTLKLQLRPEFTLNAGLRWEGQWNPSTAAVKLPNDLAQSQPRLGAAWSVSARTTIRASAGLYDAFTPAMLFERAATDTAQNTITLDSYFDPSLLPTAPFQQLPSSVLFPDSLVFGIDSEFRNPRSFQASGSVEQRVFKDAALSVGYLRNSTWSLPIVADRNLFAPSIDAFGLPVFSPLRPDASLGRELITSSSAHSSYDAMLVKFRMQLPKRSNLSINYTLARSRDNEASFDPFGYAGTLNPFDLNQDAAFSNFDARHTFNLNSIVNLPLGLKFNPILLLRSGLPYTPIAGLDLQNDANDWNDRAILAGKLSERNAARQPAFVNLDLRFVKDFTLPGEGHHLDLFLDVFNMTHATNRNFGPWNLSEYGPAANVFSAGVPLYAPDSTQLGGARQVQFTARIVAF